MNIAVLGAGMVGGVIAADLAKEHAVTSIDVNEANLERVKKTKCGYTNHTGRS